MTIEDVEDAYRKIRYQTLLVAEARAAEGRHGDPELTYGTTTPRLASQLLDLAGAGPDDIFYDLGCGFGVPTIVAALRCKRAIGIDVLPPLIARAREVAEELKLGNASFIAGDLRHADLSDGTIFYSYCTCLSEPTRHAMADAIARARPGARILTVTHPLAHPRIEVVEKTSLEWGLVSHAVFLQRLA